METYFIIVSFISEYLIKGIFLSVLIIIFCRLVFKNRLDTQQPATIARWVMVGYAFLVIINYLLVILFINPSLIPFDRALGQYWYALWIMLLANTLLPLSLFFKKLQNKIYYIFLVGLLMNTGWLMESIIVHTMSIPNDYANTVKADYTPYSNEIRIAKIGIIEGIVIMILGNLTIMRKGKKRQIA